MFRSYSVVLCLDDTVLCFDHTVFCFDDSVLCFDHTVLCFDNIVLCFDNTRELPATGREHFACQESGVSQIFGLIISNEQKILSNVNVVVSRQVTVKGKTAHFRLPVRVLCLEKCLLCFDNTVLCLEKCWLCSQTWATVFSIFNPDPRGFS